jgi:hypothetical protein
MKDGILTFEQLHILQHSLGLDQFGKGKSYRNHFVTDPGTPDGSVCLALCRLGLMVDCGLGRVFGGMHVFRVTNLGLAAVRDQSPAPPRLTRSQRRYREFLDADSGLSFGEWLRLKPAIRT